MKIIQCTVTFGVKHKRRLTYWPIYSVFMGLAFVAVLFGCDPDKTSSWAAGRIFKYGYSVIPIATFETEES